jgi:GntR family transcriptional regulator
MASPLNDTARLKIRRDVPAHRQIAAYLKAIIALGQISPGDALPGVSALAAQIGAPAPEVRRAYEELETRGFLVSEGSKWRVSDEHAAVGDAGAADDICERMWELIAEARRAGMTRSELQRMFGQLLARP